MPRQPGPSVAVLLLAAALAAPPARAETLATSDPGAIAAFKAGGTVFGFDALPGLTPTGAAGQVVPEASQVLDQFIPTHQVAIAASGGPAAVVKAAACCPGGPSSGLNMLAGTTLSQDFTSFVLDYTAPLVLVFEDANGDPAPTDRVGAWNVTNGSPVTLYAYDLGGMFEWVTAQPGQFVGVRRAGIVYAQFLYGVPGTRTGFALDDLTFGPRGTVGVGDLPAAGGLWMAPPRPNPSRGGDLALSLRLEQAAPVRLTVVGVDGRVVARRELGTLGAGRHTLEWATGIDTPGMYFVRVDTGAGRGTARRWVVTH